MAGALWARRVGGGQRSAKIEGEASLSSTLDLKSMIDIGPIENAPAAKDDLRTVRGVPFRVDLGGPREACPAKRQRKDDGKQAAHRVSEGWKDV